MDLWQRNEVAVIAGVGYPQPNRSHFRSIEIWETGSSSNEYLADGWLARVLPKIPHAGRRVAGGAVIGGLNVAVMRNARQFFRQAQRPCILSWAAGSRGGSTVASLP